MKSLRVRLLVSLLAMVAGAALLVGGLTYRSVLHETEALFDYQLRQMALSLRDQGAITGQAANALADEQFDFVVQIWSLDGTEIYASREHAALPQRAVLGFADVAVDGQGWRTFTVASRERVIQVAQPDNIRQQLAADAALHSIAPLLALGPLMALGVLWLVTASLAPLRRLVAAVRERGAAALQPLPQADLPGEVAPLVAELNTLLSRLEQAFAAQRAFVSDAAHELRSPLTALKLQLRTLQQAPDEPSREQAAGRLGQGIDRATRLVAQLLTLARNEPGARPAALVPVDLTEAVRQAVAETVPLAHARGSSLALETEAPVMVLGEADGLRVLARNLADNALRYSPPGSTVSLRIESDGAGHAELLVDDSGPGIPPPQRERVFDRFSRRAGATHGSTQGAADTDSDAEQGSGLGLAIVHSVADRFGAQVMLEDSPLGGLRVRSRFRAAPA
ncbi:MAG TPA: ATP-binding protein [Methylibium sp.]